MVGVCSHQRTRLTVNQRWGVSFRRLHQFGRSSRRWSDPRCPLCRTAAAPFSGPSERSDQSGARGNRKKRGNAIERMVQAEPCAMGWAYCFLFISQSSRQQSKDSVRVRPQIYCIYWLLLQMVTWQHFSWTWQFRVVFNWTAPTFGHTGGTCHRSIGKLVKSTSRSFGFRLAAQFQQRKAK